MVKLLLDHHALVNARELESGATPLYNAASLGREDVVQVLLDRGADVNLTNKAGATPLHAAVVNGYTAVSTLLKSHGGKDLAPKQ